MDPERSVWPKENGNCATAEQLLAQGPCVSHNYLAWLDRRNRPNPLVRAWKSNRLYFLGLLVVCAGLMLACLWPVVRDLWRDPSRTDCSMLLGQVPKKAWYESRFVWVCVTAIALLLTHFLFCFRQARLRRLRTAATVGAVLYISGLPLVYDRISSGQRALGGIVTGNVFDLQWENLRHLKIIECEYPHLHSKEQRNELRQRDLKTFAELHELIMHDYAQRALELRKRTVAVHGGDEQKLKAIFIMNYVSGLWSFGNRLEVDKTGCVLANELNGWEEPAASVRAYLDAKIGCCCDFAYMTKYLLDCEGIENRLTCIPGHVFNEVRLGGRWCIADASVNIFLETGWADLYSGPHDRDSIVVLLFPSPTSLDDRSRRFRSVTGQFRLITLLRAANHPDSLRHIYHPDLPNYFH